MQYIPERNIRCGNTLAYTAADGTPLRITEWLFDKDGNSGLRGSARTRTPPACIMRG